MIAVRLRIPLIVAVGILCCSQAFAADALEFDPVTAGERGLARSASFPWYDEQQQKTVPVDVQAAPESLKHRSSSWVKKPPQNQASAKKSGTWFSGDWSFLGTVMQVLGWTLLGAVLAALVALLGWALMQRDRAHRRQTAQQSDTVGKEAHTAQIENLPFPLEPTELDLLTEARKHFQNGDYEKAIVYLFSYQLVQLDHRQLLRLSRGKTNRQYLRELGTQTSLRSLLQQTMVLFEDAFFGGRQLTRAQFSSCWDRLNEFHQHVEQAAT